MFQSQLADAILTLLMGYVLLFDQQTYSNHLYLLVIVTSLLTVGDSGAAFSLDARSAKNRTVLRRFRTGASSFSNGSFSWSISEAG